MPPYYPLSEEDGRLNIPSWLTGPDPYFSNEDIRIVYAAVKHGVALHYADFNQDQTQTAALFRAAQDVFPEHGRAADDPNLCRLLFKVGGSRGQSLFERFYAVIEDLDSVLEVDNAYTHVLSSRRGSLIEVTESQAAMTEPDTAQEEHERDPNQGREDHPDNQNPKNEDPEKEAPKKEALEKDDFERDLDRELSRQLSHHHLGPQSGNEKDDFEESLDRELDHQLSRHRLDRQSGDKKDDFEKDLDRELSHQLSHHFDRESSDESDNDSNNGSERYEPEQRKPTGVAAYHQPENVKPTGVSAYKPQNPKPAGVAAYHQSEQLKPAGVSAHRPENVKPTGVSAHQPASVSARPSSHGHLLSSMDRMDRMDPGYPQALKEALLAKWLGGGDGKSSLPTDTDSTTSELDIAQKHEEVLFGTRRDSRQDEARPAYAHDALSLDAGEADDEELLNADEIVEFSDIDRDEMEPGELKRMDAADLRLKNIGHRGILAALGRLPRRPAPAVPQPAKSEAGADTSLKSIGFIPEPARLLGNLEDLHRRPNNPEPPRLDDESDDKSIGFISVPTHLLGQPDDLPTRPSHPEPPRLDDESDDKGIRLMPIPEQTEPYTGHQAQYDDLQVEYADHQVQDDDHQVQEGEQKALELAEKIGKIGLADGWCLQAQQCHRAIRRKIRMGRRTWELKTMHDSSMTWHAGAMHEVERTATARRHIQRKKTYDAWTLKTASDKSKAKVFMTETLSGKWTMSSQMTKALEKTADTTESTVLGESASTRLLREYGDRKATRMASTQTKYRSVGTWRNAIKSVEASVQTSATYSDRSTQTDKVDHWKTGASRIGGLGAETAQQRQHQERSAKLGSWRKKTRLEDCLQAFVRALQTEVNIDVPAVAGPTAQSREAVKRSMVQVFAKHWGLELKLKQHGADSAWATLADAMYNWLLNERLELLQRFFNFTTKKAAVTLMEQTEREASVGNKKRAAQAETAKKRAGTTKFSKNARATLQEANNKGRIAMDKHRARVGRRVAYKASLGVARHRLMKHEARRGAFYVGVANSSSGWRVHTLVARRDRLRKTYHRFRRTYKEDVASKGVAVWRDNTDHRLGQEQRFLEGQQEQKLHDDIDTINIWMEEANRCIGMGSIAVEAEVEATGNKWRQRLPEQRDSQADAEVLDVDTSAKRVQSNWELDLVKMRGQEYTAAELHDKTERKSTRQTVQNWRGQISSASLTTTAGRGSQLRSSLRSSLRSIRTPLRSSSAPSPSTVPQRAPAASSTTPSHAATLQRAPVTPASQTSQRSSVYERYKPITALHTISEGSEGGSRLSSTTTPAAAETVNVPHQDQHPQPLPQPQQRAETKSSTPTAPLTKEQRLSALREKLKKASTYLDDNQERLAERQQRIAQTDERVSGIRERHERQKREMAESTAPQNENDLPNEPQNEHPDEHEPVTVPQSVPQSVPQARTPSPRLGPMSEFDDDTTDSLDFSNLPPLPPFKTPTRATRLRPEYVDGLYHSMDTPKPLHDPGHKYLHPDSPDTTTPMAPLPWPIERHIREQQARQEQRALREQHARSAPAPAPAPAPQPARGRVSFAESDEYRYFEKS